MEPVTRIVLLDKKQQKFFGEGPFLLLTAVEKTGSLRSAAASMNMAYTKALKLLKNAESSLGFPLTMRTVGGKDGGGTHLTPEGTAWLKKYASYRNACITANRKLFLEFFPEEPIGNLGCVIMASGLGKRFGGNKLMADFGGEPLICQALRATEGIFTRRVVVTRHKDVADLCSAQGIPAVLHHEPYRSDTVRLGLEFIGEVDGCLFCPGDQPLLRRDTVLSLALHAMDKKEAIWRTVYENTTGSPVLFPKWTFPELLSLPQGKGGSVIVKKYPEQVHLVPVQNKYELMDVDTPEDLALLLTR